MKQNLFNGIQKDGNLLGYVNHKNPLIFSDSFDSAIRSEWAKWVNSGTLSDYIQSYNGKLRIQYTGNGAYNGGVVYPLPAGDWEIRAWMSGIENPNQTCTWTLLLRQDTTTHYKVEYKFTAPSTYTMKVIDHKWAPLWSMTGNEASTWRIRFQNGKLSFYRKPDSGSESLVVTTTSQIGLNNVYFNFGGSSDGFSGTVWMDDFCLTRLNHPRTYNMKPVHSYAQQEYTGALLIDYLSEPPLSSYLIRNRGRIYSEGYESSGLATYSNCTWTSKDGYSAMYFNGSDSVIQSIIVARFSNMVSSKFTVTAWAYIDPMTSRPSYILGKTPSDSASIDYALQVDPKIKGIRGHVNQAERLTVPNSIRYNDWIHLALTFDSSLGSNNLKAYVNGSLVGQATYTRAVTANSKPIFIGSRNGVAGQFKGYLRNVRLYNTALSNEEIVDEMNRDYISPVETYTVERSSITGTEEPPMQLAYY